MAKSRINSFVDARWLAENASSVFTDASDLVSRVPPGAIKCPRGASTKFTILANHSLPRARFTDDASRPSRNGITSRVTRSPISSRVYSTAFGPAAPSPTLESRREHPRMAGSAERRSRFPRRHRIEGLLRIWRVLRWEWALRVFYLLNGCGDLTQWRYWLDGRCPCSRCCSAVE
uniref:Uncharacterized protein n=1 Tax=Mycena chlorophos TaxID=658473 RepID=A0ABQ0L241_MYCCL|nr:predicted protein [Mycena chlorophos]